jgi:hypothetical protein
MEGGKVGDGAWKYIFWGKKQVFFSGTMADEDKCEKSKCHENNDFFDTLIADKETLRLCSVSCGKGGMLTS